MNLPWPWQCLGIDQSASVTVVRRRYAQLLKLNRPEDNPDRFQQVRRAYEICLAFAREQESEIAAQPDDAAMAEATTAAARDRASDVATVPEADGTLQACAVPCETEPSPVVDTGPEPAPRNDELPAIALPPLRPPVVVIDELLALDARTPHDSGVFARWFAECPEFASFVSRDSVELELLHRITAGARPKLRALQLFGAAFGWRQLGFDRHMLQIGVPREHLRAVDTALLEAGAEAQFAWHLETRQRLIPKGQESLDIDGELALLRQLHDRRNLKPRFRETLRSSRLTQINALLACYSERYGNAATLYLFGADNVAFWRSAFPGAEPNRLQALSSIARASIVVGAVMLGLVGASLAANRKPFLYWLGEIGFILLVLSAIAVPVVILVCTGRLMALRTRQAIVRFDARHEEWQQRHVMRWLLPSRGIPLSLAIGLVLGAIAYYGDTRVGLACAVATTALAFGWRSLAAYSVAAALLLVGLLPWGEDDLPAAFAGAFGLAPTLVWFADWCTRRERPHATMAQRARRSIVLALSAAALLMVGGWVLAEQLRGANDSETRASRASAGTNETQRESTRFPKSPRAVFSCAPSPPPGALA